MEKKIDNVDVKQFTKGGKRSAVKKYADVAAGDSSLLVLLKYELIMFFCINFFGAAGIMLRRIFYKYLFKSFGRNVTIGRNVSVRGPGKVIIGDNVMIDDGCVLDARGDTEIIIGDDVILSGGTVVRGRDAYLSIGRGCSIGRNCLLGTDRKLVVGEEVLLGAYTYLCAGGVHRFDGPEVSVISQGVNESQGIEVGNGAWLGARVTVLDGVTVGEGAVIGAHSMVNRDFPAMAVGFGSPAKVQQNRADRDDQAR